MSKIRVLPNRALLHIQQDMRCPVAQSIMCLTADPGVTSSILNGSHTFVEIDQEIISMVILFPYADSRRVVVSYKRNYAHVVLVNLLVKLALVKLGFGKLTSRHDHNY